MALDVGTKVIGIAISDPLKIISRPLTTIQRKAINHDVAEILRLALEHNVERVIVGKPMYLTGDRSPILDEIEALVDVLASSCSLVIAWADERLSTKAAELVMAELDVDIRERKRKRDQIAAALILQWYLEDETVGR
jgi:putative Holliday junction resolvase